MNLQIRPADLDADDTRALISAHQTSMYGSSPAESVHAIGIEAMTHPAIIMWEARIEDDLAGIGGLKLLDAQHGELKSIRVHSSHLKQGVGRALLRHIIADAQRRGMTTLWLETGSTDDFIAARRLYKSEGFSFCAPFGSYSDDPYSAFMVRSLSTPER